MRIARYLPCIRIFSTIRILSSCSVAPPDGWGWLNIWILYFAWYVCQSVYLTWWVFCGSEYLKIDTSLCRWEWLIPLKYSVYHIWNGDSITGSQFLLYINILLTLSAYHCRSVPNSRALQCNAKYFDDCWKWWEWKVAWEDSWDDVDWLDLGTAYEKNIVCCKMSIHALKEPSCHWQYLILMEWLNTQDTDYDTIHGKSVFLHRNHLLSFSFGPCLSLRRYFPTLFCLQGAIVIEPPPSGYPGSLAL